MRIASAQAAVVDVHHGMHDWAAFLVGLLPKHDKRCQMAMADAAVHCGTQLPHK